MVSRTECVFMFVSNEIVSLVSHLNVTLPMDTPPFHRNGKKVLLFPCKLNGYYGEFPASPRKKSALSRYGIKCIPGIHLQIAFRKF